MKEKHIKNLFRTDWNRLNQMDDSEIDYSDIPETNEHFWKTAKLVLPEKKSHISIRLDNDVLEWLKSQGIDYHTKINMALKGYMDAHRQ